VFLAEKLRRGAVLAPACLLLSLAAPSADAASFGPELTLEARYDDNVLKRTDGMQDYLSVLVPRLRATEVEGVRPWELRLRRTMVSYGRDPQPVALSDLMMGRGAWYMAAMESVSAGFRYTRSSEPTEVEEDAIVTGGDVFSTSGRIGIDTYRAEGELRARTWSYSRAGLSDGSSQAWGFRYFPMRTRDSGWLFAYRGENLDLDRRGLEAHVVTSGFQRRHATWLSSEIELGAVAVSYDDGADDDRHAAGAVGLVATRGEQGAPLSARLRIAHDVTTTSMAEVRQSWEAARVTARWESTLDAEGGIYRSPTVSRRAVLSLEASPDGVRRVVLEGSYRRVRPFRVESVAANLLRFSISYALPVNNWLRARVGYDHVRQDVPPGGRAVEFDRNRILVSFTAGVPR
jgi:hypothetical protein